MISSTCLVPFHGVSRLAHCNYHILSVASHTWLGYSLDTTLLIPPAAWALVHIYKQWRIQERNDDDWNDDEFSSPHAHTLHPQLFLRFPPPQKNLRFIFLTNTHDKRLYKTVDLRARTDERRNEIIDIQYYSDWATIMTYATLTPYEPNPLYATHPYTTPQRFAPTHPPNIGVDIDMP
jgi:hypothetical protein